MRRQVSSIIPQRQPNSVIQPRRSIGNPVRTPNAIDLFGTANLQWCARSQLLDLSHPLRPAISNSAYIQETLKRLPAPNNTPLVTA
jgi:hypothetical protein